MPGLTHRAARRRVRAALDAGVDVVVEKPLTTDAEGCAAIAAAAARSTARIADWW